MMDVFDFVIDQGSKLTSRVIPVKPSDETMLLFWKYVRKGYGIIKSNPYDLYLQKESSEYPGSYHHQIILNVFDKDNEEEILREMGQILYLQGVWNRYLRRN